MNNIPIKVKLHAYTKGILPDLSDYIKDVPDDGEVYVRKYKEWIVATKALEKTKVKVKDNSGLGIAYEVETDTYTLWVKKEDLTQTEFENLTQYEEDTTYYVENQTPNTFIDGGTAFSDGNNEYVILSSYNEEIDGGNAFTDVPETLFPINAKGVYNE